QESRAAAEKALAGVLDPQWAAGRKVVRAGVEGSPKVEIVRYARTQEIDLIVLATHGRTALAHVLIGSVAENAAGTAAGAVLTVRPEGHEFVMPGLGRKRGHERHRRWRFHVGNAHGRMDCRLTTGGDEPALGCAWDGNAGTAGRGRGRAR